jgi:double-stranded uracil-DNA glycosylase
MKVGIPPVAPGDARLFVLGSLPGDASLAAQRYYAHPSNQFWRLLGTALDEDLAALDYDDRLERLAERKVGLWDVIGSARRLGSLDQHIRDARHNQLGELLSLYPQVAALAFNGATAARIGRVLAQGLSPDIDLIDLPSSSAAFTRSFDQKAAAWVQLARYAGPKRLHCA